ncbi:MAG: flippase-like domain-containing protein [Candidatus Kerfeldbacteria bacterium]|nr:flippase-like domain-containing protein [Candidatus Kerfeldbacteria bacterium]
MKKIIFFGISLLVGIALFVGVFWRLGWDSIFIAVQSFTLWKWLVIVFFYSLALYVTLYRWHLILKSQGYDIPTQKLFASRLVGFAGDYLTPSPNIGGEAIRALVLKKGTGVPMAQGLASIILDKVMDFSYALPFLVFSIFYALIYFDLSAKIVLGLIAVSGTFIFLLGLFYYRTLTRRHFFGGIIRFVQLHRFSFMAKAMQKIANFEQIIVEFFKNHTRVFWQGIGLSIAGGLSTLTAMWLITRFIGMSTSFLDIILISTLTVITFLLPIPGSIGSTETGLALIFTLIGYPAEQGVVFSLIFRSVDLVKVGIGLFYLSRFGLTLGETMFAKKVDAIPVNGNGQETPAAVTSIHESDNHE